MSHNFHIRAEQSRHSRLKPEDKGVKRLRDTRNTYSKRCRKTEIQICRNAESERWRDAET